MSAALQDRLNNLMIHGGEAPRVANGLGLIDRGSRGSESSRGINLGIESSGKAFRDEYTLLSEGVPLAWVGWWKEGAWR